MSTLLSVVAAEVVVTTTFAANSDNKVDIMATLMFQSKSMNI